MAFTIMYAVYLLLSNPPEFLNGGVCYDRGICLVFGPLDVRKALLYLLAIPAVWLLAIVLVAEGWEAASRRGKQGRVAFAIMCAVHLLLSVAPVHRSKHAKLGSEKQQLNPPEVMGVRKDFFPCGSEHGRGAVFEQKSVHAEVIPSTAWLVQSLGLTCVDMLHVKPAAYHHLFWCAPPKPCLPSSC